MQSSADQQAIDAVAAHPIMCQVFCLSLHGLLGQSSHLDILLLLLLLLLVAVPGGACHISPCQGP
jgi:hypothetical protein